MAWGSLADVTTGDVIAAARENQHIDNEEYLYTHAKLLLADTLLTVSAQYVDFTGLTAYEGFELEYAIYNAAATDPVLRLYLNADYTDANYQAQLLQGDNATAAAARVAYPALGTLLRSTGSSGRFTLLNTRTAASTYGRPQYTGQQIHYNGTDIIADAWSGKRNTAGQISSIRVDGTAANVLGAGSRIRLWAR